MENKLIAEHKMCGVAQFDGMHISVGEVHIAFEFGFGSGFQSALAGNWIKDQRSRRRNTTNVLMPQIPIGDWNQLTNLYTYMDTQSQ